MSNISPFYPQRNKNSNCWSSLPQIIQTLDLLAPSSTLFLNLILNGWNKEDSQVQQSLLLPRLPLPIHSSFREEIFSRKCQRESGYLSLKKNKNLKCFTISQENLSPSCKYCWSQENFLLLFVLHPKPFSFPPNSLLPPSSFLSFSFSSLLSLSSLSSSDTRLLV